MTPTNNRSIYLVLIVILVINIFLTIQGIGWGLPDRWNVDQKVTEALKMASERTIVSPDYYHPPFYTYLLILALAPYVLYLKFTNYPLDQVASLAADSWIKIASVFPDFATNVFISARLFSCLLGVLTIITVFFTVRRIGSPLAALLASGILAFTMGFVGSNHLEISTSLINLIGAVVVYFCIKAVDTRKIWDLAIGSFCSGIAMATKLNGVFLVPLPFITCFILQNKVMHVRRIYAWLLLALVAGFLIGWPTYFATLPGVTIGYNCYANFLFSASIDLPIVINFINYMLQLVVILGIPFSLFIMFGSILAIRQIYAKDKARGKFIIIFSLILPYIFMNSVSVHHQHPYTKYIIFIVPQLAIIGGVGAYKFLKRIPVVVGFLTVAVFFVYSIGYTISGNAQFIKNDIRYKSTNWIEQHIPRGSIIEHVDQVDWLFSSKILKNYRIMYLGRDSATYTSKSFYKLNETGDLKDVASIIENYCGRLNSALPSSEYFLIFLPEVADLNLSVKPVSEYDKLIKNFLTGKFPYDLVAKFQISNWREISSVIKGLSYPRNILWGPIPDNAYMPSVILIYKRK